MLHRLIRISWIAILGISLSPAWTAAEIPARAAKPGLSLSPEEARAAALSNNPAIRRSAAAVEAAEGRLLAARTYPFNPVVAVEAANRDGAGDTSTDRAFSLSQEVEIAGQKGKRTEVARAALTAAKKRHQRRRREVLTTVDDALAATVRNRELLAVARADVELTRSLLSYQERRLEAGAGTQIDVNLARAATGRAVRRRQEAAAAWAAARAHLAEVTGLDPASPPQADGALPRTAPPLPDLATLTVSAMAARADLAASREEQGRAERRVALERSLAIPNLDLGTYVADEEGDEIVGLRVGIALPLLNRNQGGISEADSLARIQDAELAAAELRVRREVATAYSRYQAAAAALAALAGLVVENLEESLELLRRAVDAGELSATDVLLLRRELVEGRREHIEVAGELWLAHGALELAVGKDLPATREEMSR